MTKCKNIPAAVAIMAAVAVSACGDAASPNDVDIFVLRSIAGETLPAVFQDGDFAVFRILADTLFLSDDGGGRKVSLVEIVDKSNGSETSYTDVTDLVYTLSDGRIEIEYECDDFASCIAPPHLAGVFTALGLEFDVSLGRVPLVYERNGGQSQ